jgi:hypothetical protein
MYPRKGLVKLGIGKEIERVQIAADCTSKQNRIYNVRHKLEEWKERPCGMIDMRLRKIFRSTFEMSKPSILIDPSNAFKNRNKANVKVVFPEPVLQSCEIR